MSQPFILNNERLMRQSNHRIPVAAEKWVEGRTACPLIFLNLGEESERGRLGLTKGDPCRQSKDFNNEQRKGNSLLSPRGRRRVPVKVSKKEKRKFRKRKTRNKTINYQPSRKEIPWAEAPYQNRHFPPS